MPATVPIPAWNAEGLIPPTDVANPTSSNRAPYPAALGDVVMRFNTSAARAAILRGLLDYRAAYALRSVSLRYFNAAGADPDGESGELHDPETHLIPLALDAVLDSRCRLSVFGDDYATPDGTCVRDYIHVSDLAQAHVMALRLLDAENTPPAMNVGTGHGYSVREVLDAIARVTGRAVPHDIASRRVGDPAELVGDSSLLRQLTGWHATHSDIDTIIRTAWAWHQTHRNPGQVNSC